MSVERFITEHLDLWTEAVTTKSTSGRSSNGKTELTGIQKLRELILELALRGQLVPQNSQEEQAADLLTDVATERAELVKEGQTKRRKQGGATAPDEPPFHIPEGWRWVQLSELCHLENGDRGKNYPNKSALVDSGVPFVNAGNLEGFSVSTEELTYITHERFDLLRSGKFRDGDILFCLRGSVGKCALVDSIPEGAIASSLIITRPLTTDLAKYLMLFLQSPLSKVMISRFDNGTAQPNLSGADFGRFALPLPGRDEQHRIVQKVDELMALCDRLEQQTRDQHAAHETLVDALLDTLTQSKDAGELADNWARLAAHLDTLFTTEQSIERFKHAILQFAVMGRLVPQDSTDEPATALLERIAEKKTSLTANGQIKKPKELPPVADHENRFDLPLSWTWTRLGTIAQINPRNTAENETETSFVPMPLITSSYTGEHSQETKLWSDIKKGYTHFADGDIALAKITPCFENSKAAVFRNLHNGIGAGTTELHVARPYEATIDPLFILYCLKSPSFLARGKARMTGTAGQKRLPKDFFAFDPIPLPPLAEQHRIVKKVEKLMTICDQLKSRLNKAGETRRQMADAVVEQAIH